MKTATFFVYTITTALVASTTSVYATDCTTDQLTTIMSKATDAATACSIDFTKTYDASTLCAKSDCLTAIKAIISSANGCTTGGVDISAAYQAIITACENKSAASSTVMASTAVAGVVTMAMAVL